MGKHSRYRIGFRMREWLAVAVLVIGTLIFTSVYAPAHIAAQKPTPTPIAGQAPVPDTLTQLFNTDIPVRDRVELAVRLMGRENVPRVATTPAPDYDVGDTAVFWADNSDDDRQFQVTAVLVYETEHLYVWLEQGYQVDMDAVAESAEQFENLIYPTTRRYFGSEWNPGVDGDPHIYILLAGDLGYTVAAYYGSASEYPVEAVATSNQHEMFFVNLDTMAGDIGTDYYNGVLAHEFQHMIHWNVDANESTWLNEGLSELSTFLNGLDSVGFSRQFLLGRPIQLNTWPEEESSVPYYGAAYLFCLYFLQRFGEDAIMQLVADQDNGMISVENTLRAIGATDPETGRPITSEDFFGDWVVTNYLNDPTVADGRYAYTLLPNLPQVAVTFEHNSYPVNAVDVAIPQYSAHYIRLNGNQVVNFSFSGMDTVRLVPTEPHSGRYMWWSNRADESDSTLTRAFDLSGVDRATLEFWTWYHIEALWDYAYVEVSTDGGVHWSILETANTTRENPHDNAYGPGYTGTSGGDTPQWIHEQVDLTPYVGGDVLIRFEYITDDAVNQHGMVIDDISIPEIGYFDDFESGYGGWESAGWLLSDNTLPQRYIVQLIQGPPGGVTVTRLLGPDDGTEGTWRIGLGDGETVIVISALAPVTTEQARYSYRIDPVQLGE